MLHSTSATALAIMFDVFTDGFPQKYDYTRFHRWRHAQEMVPLP
jgi:hypothetical protein